MPRRHTTGCEPAAPLPTFTRLRVIGTVVAGYRLMPHRALRILILLAVVLAPRLASAGAVERIVATVDGQPILESTLRLRLAPHLRRVETEVPNPIQRAVQARTLRRTMLKRLIDERLVERAAQAAHVAVTDQDVDQALSLLAKQNGMSPQNFVTALVAASWTLDEYRRELRAQILDRKWFAVRARKHAPSATTDDLTKLHERWIDELRNKAHIQLRVPD